MSFYVYTKLVNSIVEPVLFYCAGILGIRYYKEIDVVLNKACMYLFGTNKNALRYGLGSKAVVLV